MFLSISLFDYDYFVIYEFIFNYLRYLNMQKTKFDKKNIHLITLDSKNIIYKLHCYSFIVV